MALALSPLGFRSVAAGEKTGSLAAPLLITEKKRGQERLVFRTKVGYDVSELGQGFFAAFWPCVAIQGNRAS